MAEKSIVIKVLAQYDSRDMRRADQDLGTLSTSAGKLSQVAQRVSAGLNSLKGDFKGMGEGAGQSALELAAVKQQSQLLDSKMNDLARSVAKGEKSFDEAERELEEYRRTMAKLPDAAEKSSRSFGIMDVALGNLAADAFQQATGAIVDFVGGSIDLASNAGETASLLENSLGPAAVGFSQDMDRVAEATNRSSIELEAGASTIVAMTRSMGFGQQAAADFSGTMAQVAVDLGSFFNQSTEQVFQDIQSALAGSAETMLKYGIDVKETALQQAAFEMGLIGAGEKLDRITRAQVLQSEIMRQAADAMGDAERTADSFSNTQRGLEAATLDLQAALGDQLVPSLLEVTVAATGAVRALGATLEAKRVRDELRLLGDQYKDLQKAISDTAAQELRHNTIWEARRVEAQLTTQVLRLLEAGVEGTAEEMVGYAQAAIAANIRAEAMNDAFKDQAAAAVQVERRLDQLAYGVRQVTYAELDAADAAEAFVDSIDQKTIERLTALFGDEGAALNYINRVMLDSEKSTGAYEVSVEQVNAVEERRQEALEKSIALTEKIAQIVAGSAQKQIDAAGGLFAAYDDLAAAQGEYVTIYSDNSSEIADIQAQLMADLSDEQKEGLQAQLDELNEFSPEAIAIWNQLQGDLSESQRRSLIAQLADLQGAHGEMQSVYTGDAVAAEEAQRRIDAAMGGITSEYQNMLLAITEARLSALFAEDGEISHQELLNIELAMISLKEEMGLLSSDAAAAMRELALTSDTAGQSFNQMLDGFLADGELTEGELEELAQAAETYSGRAQEAFSLVDVSVTNSQAVINTMRQVGVEDFQALQSEIGNIPPTIMAIKDAAQETAGEYNIHFKVTSDPFPQPVGGGATGGGTGVLPGPEPPGGSKGGLITGGIANRDSVLMRLMPGEFVLQKSAVRELGIDTLHQLNQGAPSGAIAMPGMSVIAAGNGRPQVNFQSNDKLLFLINDAGSAALAASLVAQQRRQAVMNAMGY